MNLQYKAYESAAAVVAAMDLGTLFGDDMYEKAMNNDADMDILVRVQKDIVHHLSLFAEVKKKSR